MKCPNCGREETWEDASFCPRCGQQLITIFQNSPPAKNNTEDKKIDLQIYQLSLWVFLTLSAFFYVSGLVPKGSVGWTIGVIIGCFVAAAIVRYFCTRVYLSK